MAPDPTQFAPTPNEAIANAASRRLNAMGPMGASPTFTVPPPAPTPVQMPGQMPMMAATHNAQPPGIAYGAPSHAAPPMAPSAAARNPLIGGSGNAGLDRYLGTDTTYQTQLSDLMRQYDQYNAQRNLQASQTQADYDAKERALNTQADQDRINMRDASAARGILYSGIYANQLGQYNDANQQQMTNLLGGLQNAKDTAQLAYSQFVSNELNAKAQAIQQAAARRAASLGKF